MERSLYSLIGSTLFGVATFGIASLGFLWSSPGSGSPPPKAEGDWRLLDPISYENLTVFPVVSSGGYDTSAFLTLEEGISQGAVVLREQGAETMIRDRDGSRRGVWSGSGPSVNQLVLINQSKRPLLLLSGELVSGGKQDRIIAKDRIVAPGSDPLPLNVFCVEHGRWSAGAQFTAADTIVHPSVREQAAVKQKQTDVWASVMTGSSASRAGTAGAPSVDALVNEIQRRFRKETAGLKGQQVVGVVIAYGDEVAWSDIFASGELFAHYWNKLLRSYAVEAVARPALRERPSTDDAMEFLKRLEGREETESEPGVYRWRAINQGGVSQIELEALSPKVMTLHRLMLRRTS